LNAFSARIALPITALYQTMLAPSASALGESQVIQVLYLLFFRGFLVCFHSSQEDKPVSF